MFQVKMVGTKAQIYADEQGVLKSFDDIKVKIKKLNEQFKVDSIVIDDGVNLNKDEVKQLTGNFVLEEIHKKINEETDVFEFSPIDFESIQKQFFSILGKDRIALTLCFVPLIVVSVVYYIVVSKVVSSTILGTSLTSIFTVLGVLGLGYIKTLTSLHYYFLNDGKRQGYSEYFLLNKKDFSFIFSAFIMELRVMLFLACLFVPLALILSLGDSVNIERTGSVATMITILIAIVFMSLFSSLSARYVLALPAIIANREKCRTSWSYSVTKGNGWRITALVFSLPVIIEAIIYSLNFNGIFVVGVIARVIYLTMSVGMLALCFKHITEKCIKIKS